MNNLYFDDVIQLGKLYLEYVFYEFENEPILFSCVDKDKNLFLCLCSEIRHGQKWIITKCSINTLKALIDERIDIASAFLINSNVFAIHMDLQGVESSYIIQKEQIDRLDLPKEGTFIRCNKEKAKSYLWKKEYESIYMQTDWNIRTSPGCADTQIESYNYVIHDRISLSNSRLKEYYNMIKNILIDKLNESSIRSTEAKNDYCVNITQNYSNIINNGEVDISNNEYIEAA